MNSRSSPAPPLIDNRTARRLYLDRHGLAANPSVRQGRQELLATIRALGFVQVDSIKTVERAHHMILFARNQTYRKTRFDALLGKDRALFENWTHDAAVIPMEFYPYWRTRFGRTAEKLKARWQAWRREGFEAEFETILDHIRVHGGCMARDVGGEEKKSNGGWWDWHPSKTALEYLWRTGQLGVCHRRGFQKVYDLAERVVPECHRGEIPGEAAMIDWACGGALDRLGFAQPGELASFWDCVTPEEAKVWCAARRGDALIEIGIETAGDGPPRRAFARPDILEKAREAAEPPGRIRVLSPFDPALRDRNRTERLFGFHYRIEVFVPEAKRRYGYYVFPLLEGDRLIGRIDMKCRREDASLNVAALWLEPKVKPTAGRLKKLEAELDRVARFAKCPTVRFADGWLRDEGSGA